MIKRSLIKYLISGAVLCAFLALAYYLTDIKPQKKVVWDFNEGWYETFDLTNGMQVIVIPNHKVAAVSHMVWYKAGAMEDPRGKTGIAHFLEHLMFKGTESYPDGEFSRLVAKHGGRENAFTSHDYTAYFQNIAKENLEMVMKLEADRMRNLQLKPEQVDSERKVIIEERKMTLDNIPRRLLMEQMDAALYVNHPYGTQIIGWQQDMEQLSQQDAFDFYHKYYTPNNAILVVAGDVNADEVKKLANKYYGKIKPFNVPKPVRYSLPEQTAEKRVALKDGRVKEPEFFRSYIAPSHVFGETENAFPLIIISKILGEGTVSRLYKSLVIDQKLAVSSATYYDGIKRGPSEFTIYAIPASGVDMAELEQSINEEVQKIADFGVSIEELEFAKKAIIAEQIYAKEGLSAMAHLAGQVAVVGLDPDYITTYSDRINAVSLDQIQDAANAVLKKSSSVTGILENE
jgi:zinc protease